MARRPAAPVTKVIDPEPRIWAYSIADDVEIGPKLVVEAGSHLCLIEVLKRANRAAATESDDQMVELPNPCEKSLQFHGVARVYRMPRGSVADPGRRGRGIIRRASDQPNLRTRATQFDGRGQTDPRSASDDNRRLPLKHTALHVPACHVDHDR
jgi:hypothetical protein